MILPYDANPRPDGIFGKDGEFSSTNRELFPADQGKSLTKSPADGIFEKDKVFETNALALAVGRKEMRHNKPLKVLGRLCAVLAAVSLMVYGPSRKAIADVSTKEKSESCREVGAWLDPDTGAVVSADELLGSLAKRKIFLLGETHDSVEDHRWQLHTLAGLHAHRSRLIVGFEMFPRAVQPALDAWSKGLNTEADFLEASRWREVWSYDPEFYLPLFHFVRQNRLRMIALNVDRKLVSRVGQDGWNKIPEEAREGISDPAPASDLYRRALAEVYAAKLTQGAKDTSKHGRGDRSQGTSAAETPDISAILESEDFARFVEAQLTWDRAMAEALFRAASETPEALVVGVLGRGHIEHGYGVPHQLSDLGEDSVAILLPVETGPACEALEPEVADAAFVVASVEDEQGSLARPRLGVTIEQAEDGVRVLNVVESSVAEATGLAPGDVIVSAATFPVDRVSELIEIVQRQAPGTWLPLELKREGATRRLIAKFPPRFE